MFRYKIIPVIGLLGLGSAFAQNDEDAIRYSRPGVGGTSRFTAMGGAFGAVGADVSTTAYNPAGLAVFRKGELTFSGGLKLINNTGNIYNRSTSTTDASFVFNNFGLALAWKSERDEESRHALAFTNTQLQNFNSSIRMEGYTNNSSIGKDMVSLANYEGNVDYLNSSYEYMGYQTFLLDSTDGRFVSLVDTKRSVMQTRDLVTSGRQNEINISYAYTYKDKYYLGASIGLPRISYESTMTHSEFDDRDSMRIMYDNSGVQTDTYVDGLPPLSSDYVGRGGFRNLTYTEYFKTTGTGFNLKIGGIARVSESLRLGAYFHTPTVYNLTDTYYNEMSVTFDKRPNEPDYYSYPADDGGYFKYRLVTPARLGLNGALLFGKMGLVAVDYEYINYRRAQLSSTNIGDFSGVNNVIRSKYKAGHTVRVGGELNMKPVMIRAGYAMQGSAFGDSFGGQFVRHTFSAGLGFRGEGRWYADLVFARSMSSEDYFLFTTLATKAKLDFSGNMIGATVGIKF